MALIFFMCDPLIRRVEAQVSPKVDGGFFEIVLPVPKRYLERQYLGIPMGRNFRLTDIQAEVLIIHVFSMYCPCCQKDAPNVTTLHDIILDRPDVRDTVKIIGIGVGNTAFEVKAFKDLYGIDFPLFADDDSRLHGILGGVEIPYFFVVRLGAGGEQKVLYSSEGSFGDPIDFLDWILEGVKG